MATAIFACDMINQVMQRCPTNTPIPTAVWVKLSFYQKSISKSFCTLSGNAKVKACCSELTELKEANLKIPP